jgi:hypothetical protein
MQLTILSYGIMEQSEELASELRAISHWDREYRRNQRPDWYETVAFVSRQKRRNEIIRDLLSASGHDGIRAVADGKKPTGSQSQSEGQKRKFNDAEGLAGRG